MPSNLKPLLSLIRKIEGRNDYNIVWGGIREKDRPANLTSMTIRQVLAWQDSIDARYMSEAAGAYQILEDTLRGLWAEAGASLDDKFDAETQDQLAVQLLKRRGLKAYLAGTMSRDTFCNNLAKEWASFPVVTGPKKGQSYYGGDGLNKALVPVKVVQEAVDSIKVPEFSRPVSPPPPKLGKPVPLTWWGWFINLLKGKF